MFYIKERKGPMKKFIRFSIIGFAILIIAACSNNEQQGSNVENNAGLGNVGDFSAITQSGEEFNVKDLEGSWWVADFIFTNCETATT